MNDLSRAICTYQILDYETVAIGFDLTSQPHLGNPVLVENDMRAFMSLYAPRIHAFKIQYIDVDKLVITVKGDINHVVPQA